ncbi:gliding motility-associated C-terminal domain-containing protein [uncultured Fibrella sp.]|uniref:gliding motility-associated C-terminal domain-containing protein n=1 Tax=uncultured Fibrella sp. TaxID=1284596 RepID=UPI0035C9A6EA
MIDKYQRETVIRYVLIALLLTSSRLVWASHIMGGELTMRVTNNTPGLFLVQMNQYWNELNANTGNRDPSATVGIFRKRDNALMDTVRLVFRQASSVAYKNVLCAQQRNLRTLKAIYNATIQLDKNRYADAEGYYISWDRCCRNNDISNIANGTNVGMLFYMEFPAMVRNGSNVVNSSPEFGFPNGEYICQEKLFTTDFSATDADGDELRYSIVTPMRGFTSFADPLVLPVSHSSFPLVSWSTGLSAQNAIPGNPALAISSTGKLSVKANRQGLFLFTVQVEEWRNGVRIGLVRRDFQLPVVDCNAVTPPPAVILSKGQALSAVSVCLPASVTLTTENDPKWSYQWQKNESNLIGSTGPTLTVATSGTYTVVKSSATTCTNETISQAVLVTLSPSLTLTGETYYRVAPTVGVPLPVRPSLPGTTLTWRPPLYLDDPASLNPVCTPLDSVTYQVTGTSPAGCKAGLRIRVVVANRLFIPSAFTPNDDGKNDTWTLQNIESMPDADVFIFNRWGSVIFYSKGYATPWTGRVGDTPAPSGLYTYLIRTGFPGEEYRGELTLLR